MAQIVTLPPPGPPFPDGARHGGWWRKDSGSERILCELCPRACHLKPGDRGFCFVRENRDGEMALTTYGRSTGFCIDPIEKKPLNHFFPGTSVLSFGTAGCNLGCKFCQNHDISKSREVARLSELATPQAIAAAAISHKCHSVAFTYNDPVIWAEYAIDTAKACRQVGVKSVAVTAGYITPQARAPFFEFIDAANVDLKAFTEEFYYRLTLSHLQPVLDTLVWLQKETDVWFEITNLIIPRANDSDDELRRLCDWVLAELGDQVPVHFTAFHPDYKLTDRPRTPAETLLAAHAQARRCGLKYVYVGNIFNVQHQSTYCASCGKMLIERNWHELGGYHLNENRCRFCDAVVAGRFQKQPGTWGRKRQPVQISQFLNPSSPKPARAAMSSSPSTVQTLSATTAPELNDNQKQQIHRAAGELLAAAARGQAIQLSDATLAGTANQPVYGVFVSAKRKGRLRGCCGFMGQRATLLSALQHAAQRTATDDVRLPPISPSELSFLDVEVWLLFGLNPVSQKGADRISAVTIGKHGLQIARGNQRGLLLPGVAIENKLDAEGFLQQVCMKAGLPPTAWKEDNTQLFTFEGISINQPTASQAASAAMGTPSSAARITDQDLQALAQHCRGNLMQLMQGSFANYYLLGTFDGNVNGIAISLRVEGGSANWNLTNLSMRPGIPLQATMGGLMESAARVLRAHSIDAAQAAQVRLDLAVLYDPAMHGTLSAPDLDGFDGATRMMIASERNKTVWLFDPSISITDVVERLRQEVAWMDPASVSLFSLRAHVTCDPLVFVNQPQPQTIMSVRPPAVAGAFYPAEADQLQEMVTSLFESKRVKPAGYKAVMAPHAGLKYSGRIAAEVFGRVKLPETVVIIGPKHTPLGVDWAVAPHSHWKIPSGELAADTELAKELVEAIEPLQFDAAAHQREHGIEVELPLIAHLAPQTKVVGIAIGAGDLAKCQQFAAKMAQVLRRRKNVLLVISSDMNHFANDSETRRLDELALTAMESLDPEKLYHTVRDNHISMCGVLPAVMVMQTLKNLKSLKKCERVAYATTADVTGDKSRVVGYAGMTIR